MNIFHKSIAILLTIALIFGMLPNLPAMNEPEITAQETIDSPAPKTEVKAYIAGEIKELRDKTSKHFRMTDGSIKAAVYPDAVHYLKNGKWEDIDNSMKDAVDTSGKPVLENKSNSYKVKFAKQGRQLQISQPYCRKPGNKLGTGKPSDCRYKKQIRNSGSCTGKYKPTR